MIVYDLKPSSPFADEEVKSVEIDESKSNREGKSQLLLFLACGDILHVPFPKCSIWVFSEEELTC